MESTLDKPLHPAVILATIVTLHSRLLDMLKKVFKNEEKKIPIVRLCFQVTSLPSAERDLLKRCYYFSLIIHAFIISML